MAGMMRFEGFAGVSLAGRAYGLPDDPAVLLLHGAAQEPDAWHDVAVALAEAGRYVIGLVLRGHGRANGHKAGSTISMPTPTTCVQCSRCSRRGRSSSVPRWAAGSRRRS